MGETEQGVQRVQSSIGASSSSLPKLHQPVCFNSLDIPQSNTARFRQFSPNLNADNGSKRVGIPPIPPLSPYSQVPVTRNNQETWVVGSGSGISHSLSLSQPSIFSLDSLPPMSPSPYRDSPSAPASDHDMLNPTRIPENLPPRKAHRRSNSDIPFGFSTILQSSPPLIPLRGPNGMDKFASSGDNQGSKLVKQESKGGGESNPEGMGERKSEGEVVDDLFNAYMSLDNLDRFKNPQGTENREELDSSDNEATSSVNDLQRSSGASDKREGIKRSASGEIAPTTRHYRSVSMDSVMEKMSFVDESLKLIPSPGGSNSNAFSLEFGNGEFTGDELKKIMANDKLTEIALADPKRAKRILANRQSAARSKERKMRYITELEHKVQTLQTEATTLSAQVTLLQREATGLTSQNNELKFRVQAMEQQAQLRDALNDALTAEVQRLKMAAAELSGDAVKFSRLSINPQMFQLHQMQQQQNASSTLKHESTQ